jgi:hypothetical protein
MFFHAGLEAVLTTCWSRTTVEDQHALDRRTMSWIRAYAGSHRSPWSSG